MTGIFRAATQNDYVNAYDAVCDAPAAAKRIITKLCSSQSISPAPIPGPALDRIATHIVDIRDLAAFACVSRATRAAAGDMGRLREPALYAQRVRRHLQNVPIRKRGAAFIKLAEHLNGASEFVSSREVGFITGEDRWADSRRSREELEQLYVHVLAHVPERTVNRIAKYSLRNLSLGTWVDTSLCAMYASAHVVSPSMRGRLLAFLPTIDEGETARIAFMHLIKHADCFSLEQQRTIVGHAFNHFTAFDLELVLAELASHIPHLDASLHRETVMQLLQHEKFRMNDSGAKFMAALPRYSQELRSEILHSCCRQLPRDAFAKFCKGMSEVAISALPPARAAFVGRAISEVGFSRRSGLQNLLADGYEDEIRQFFAHTESLRDRYEIIECIDAFAELQRPPSGEIIAQINKLERRVPGEADAGMLRLLPYFEKKRQFEICKRAFSPIDERFANYAASIAPVLERISPAIQRVVMRAACAPKRHDFVALKAIAAVASRIDPSAQSILSAACIDASGKIDSWKQLKGQRSPRSPEEQDAFDHASNEAGDAYAFLRAALTSMAPGVAASESDEYQRVFFDVVDRLDVPDVQGKVLSSMLPTVSDLNTAQWRKLKSNLPEPRIDSWSAWLSHQFVQHFVYNVYVQSILISGVLPTVGARLIEYASARFSNLHPEI